MPSAIFLLGRADIGSDLTLEVFQQYVQPLLKKEGAYVQSAAVVPDETHQRLLVAVARDGAPMLEGIMSEVLISVGKTIEQEIRVRAAKDDNYRSPVDPYQLFEPPQEGGGKAAKGVYELLGDYKGIHDAANAFPQIEAEYRLRWNQSVVDGLKTALKQIADNAEATA